MGGFSGQISSKKLTRGSGSNLASALFCLPPPRREAMTIFYGFCRCVDDIADSPQLPIEEKRKELSFWREELQRIYRGEPSSPLGQELVEVIQKYEIPQELFQEIVAGVGMDLEIRRYPTFEDLKQYCYRVACAVGLVSIRIFGCRHPLASEYAVSLGMAFQLTNILRDVGKDASTDRIYLPLEECHAFGVREEQILRGEKTPGFDRLLFHQYWRARHYFQRSLRLLPAEERPKLIASELMRGCYWKLLEKLKQRGFPVRGPKVNLSKGEKFYVLVSSLYREKRRPRLPKPCKKVVILGAGVAGLTAAIRLAQTGHRVILLESRQSPGGRAGSFWQASRKQKLDTGQHILMGCYRRALALLEELDLKEKTLALPLRLPVLEGEKQRVIRVGKLPSPFHLWAGLLDLEKEPRWFRASVELASSLIRQREPDPTLTALVWLRAHQQPEAWIRLLWQPFCLASTNLGLEECSARLFYRTLLRSLWRSEEDCRIILPKSPLGELLAEPLARLLGFCGGKILYGQKAVAFSFDGDRLHSVSTAQGLTLEADQFICALPWEATAALVPPESDLAYRCRSLGRSSILNGYLWFDQPILEEPVVGFVDCPVHWVFNRTLLQDLPPSQGFSYVVVTSRAEKSLVGSFARIQQRVLCELQYHLPKAREAKLLDCFWTRFPSATPELSPSREVLRPGCATGWRNLWLAGDWTNTGLPATIEGAVQSGEEAALLAGDA